MMRSLSEIRDMTAAQFSDWSRKFYRFQMMYIYQHWYTDLKRACLQQNEIFKFSGPMSKWQDYKLACDRLLGNHFVNLPMGLRSSDQYLQEFRQKYYIFSSSKLSEMEKINALIAFEKKILELDTTDFNQDKDWPEQYQGEDLELFIKGYWQEIFSNNLPQANLRWFELLYCLQRENFPVETIDSNEIYDIFLKLLDPDFREQILSININDTALVSSDYLGMLQAHAQMLIECPDLAANYKVLMPQLKEQNLAAILHNFEENYALLKEMRDRGVYLPDNPLLKSLKLIVTLAEQIINGDIKKYDLAPALRKYLGISNPDFNTILLKLLQLDLKTQPYQVLDAAPSKIIQEKQGFLDEANTVQKEYPQSYLQSLIFKMNQQQTFAEKRKIYDAKNQELTQVLTNLSELIRSKKDDLFPSKTTLLAADQLAENPIDAFLVLLEQLKAPKVDLSVRHRALSEWVNRPENRQLLKVDSRMQWLKQLINAIFAALGKKKPVFTLQQVRQDLSIFNTKPNQEKKHQVSLKKPK